MYNNFDWLEYDTEAGNIFQQRIDIITGSRKIG